MQAIGVNLNQQLKHYADLTSQGMCCNLDDILTEIQSQNADLVEGNKVSLIQIMCHLAKEDEALSYLHTNHITRLGAYVPVLTAYMKRSNLTKVWQVYQEMKEKNVVMKQENYSLLLGWLLSNKYLIEFDKVLSDMCEAKLVPDKSVWIIISKRFEHFDISVPTECGLCKKCNTKLQVVDVPEARRAMCDILEQKITNNTIWQQFLVTLRNNKYQFVIDGANVGRFNNHGKLNVDHKKISMVVSQLGIKKCLVVLHQRHESVITKLTKANIIVQTVPKNHDDDWFSLYAALKLNIYLVSNDQGRNHGYMAKCQKELQWWMSYHKVTLAVNANEYNLIFPRNYSQCIQKNNGHWHVPFVDSQSGEVSRNWLCCY